jgi:hypothetical protein
MRSSDAVRDHQKFTAMLSPNDSTWCHQNGGMYSTSPGAISAVTTRSAALA